MITSNTTSNRQGCDLPSLAEFGHDLTKVTAWQRWRAIATPFLCTSAFVMFACLGWWWLAVIATGAYSFFSYGSTSHDLVHGTLGLPRRLNHVLLTLVELLGVRSGHAYREAHLRHHHCFPHADDIEAGAAHGSWLEALLTGPNHQLRIWWWAWRNARRYRRWILLEGIGCATIVAASIMSLPVTPIPFTYVALVMVGSWTFPLITSYLPHNPAASDRLTQTLRFRGRVAGMLFGQHLYHLEHHLYPAVPHHHWRVLAERLDPYLDRAGVRPVYLGF
jgi:beta-carotene hydroxylase